VLAKYGSIVHDMRMKRRTRTFSAVLIALLGAGTTLFVTVLVAGTTAVLGSMQNVDCLYCSDLTGLRIAVLAIVAIGVVISGITYWGIFTALKPRKLTSDSASNPQS
jgi:hypothetical protein